jgi:hypothetical protein
LSKPAFVRHALYQRPVGFGAIARAFIVHVCTVVRRLIPLSLTLPESLTGQIFATAQ